MALIVLLLMNSEQDQMDKAVQMFIHISAVMHK